VVRVPILTAGVLAEERRNQTLGLLFLSGLGSGEVFASKFLSSALVAFTNLLAIFPMLALPFLLGGISFDLFLATICGLPALMLLTLALSLLASALTRDEGSAVILAFVLGVLLCGLTPAIYLAQSYFSLGATHSLWWLRLSPIYGPLLVNAGFRSGFSPAAHTEFWQNLGVTVIWSVLALGTAGFALKRSWRDRPQEGAMGWRERWRELVHGSRQARRRLAQKRLEQNPFVWLSSRDRQPATVGWLAVGGIVMVWLVCWAAWPARWPSVQNFFITATLLNVVLAWLTRHTAAHLIGSPRRDGAYELMLTTPMQPNEIVSGTIKALRGHFLGLVSFVLLLDVLMMIGGVWTRPWNERALAVYFIVWAALLAWTWSLGHRLARVFPVMWISLNCSRPAYAVWRSSGFNPWSWIWIFFNFQTLGRGFQRFPTGSLGETAIVLLIAVILLIVLAKRARVQARRVQEMKWEPLAKDWVKGATELCETRLIREFREIVQEPLPDPSDPRFKRWNLQERFPWKDGLPPALPPAEAEGKGANEKPRFR